MEKTHWRTQFGERLRESAEKLLGGVEGLAKLWNMKSSTGIYGYFRGDRIPGGELLEKLTYKINIHWLLTGEGNMYNTNDNDRFNKLLDENKFLKKKINMITEVLKSNNVSEISFKNLVKEKKVTA